MSLGLCIKPPGLSWIWTRGPWPWGKGTEGGWPAFTGASAHRRRGLGWGKRRRGWDEPKGGLFGARGGRIGGSPRRGAAAAWVARRRPFCGGGLGWGRCLGDAQYSCGANGGVCGGGSGLKWWVRGGGLLAGVQVDGGGALVAIGRRSRA